MKNNDNVILYIPTMKRCFVVHSSEGVFSDMVSIYEKSSRDGISGVLTFYCESIKKNIMLSMDKVEYLSWKPWEEN